MQQHAGGALRREGLAWPAHWNLDDAGAERSHHPREAMELLRPHLAELGITRIARITDLDRLGVPVWSAFRPNSRSLAVSQGKGLDDDTARIAAVMEAIELAIAEAPCSARVEASSAELAVRTDAFSLLPTLIAAGRRLPSPETRLEWLRAFDLLSHDEVWVPAEAVMLDHTRDACDPATTYWMSTDGLASGLTLGEAVLHGLLERIERDATTLFEFAPKTVLAVRRLDANGLGSDRLVDLERRFIEADLDLHLFDVTADIGIPVILALAAEAGAPLRRHFELAAGSAAHQSFEIAAIKAVVEAAQARLTIIAGARDDFLPDEYEAGLGPGTADLVEVAREPRAQDRPAMRYGSASRHLSGLCAHLSAVGLTSILAVPLSAPSSPFAVVKVVVEELECGPGARARRYGRRALRAMMGGWR